MAHNIVIQSNTRNLKFFSRSCNKLVKKNSKNVLSIMNQGKLNQLMKELTEIQLQVKKIGYSRPFRTQY